MPSSHQIPGAPGVGVSWGLPREALVWHSSHHCTNPQNNHKDQQEIHFLNMAEIFVSLGWFYPLSSTSKWQTPLCSIPAPVFSIFFNQVVDHGPISTPFFFLNRYLTSGVIQGVQQQDITTLLTGKHLSISSLIMLVAISTLGALITGVQSKSCNSEVNFICGAL